MAFLLCYIIGWLAAVIIIVTSHISNTSHIIHTLLLCHLTISVGFVGLIGAQGHLLMHEKVAKHIGWASGSLFQRELGYCCLGMGIMGIMCYWYQDNFWLATIVLSCTFLLGAAWVHIKEMITKKNFNPGNAVSTIPDILIPATLTILWMLKK